MAIDRLVADQDVRDLVSSDLSRTYLVEAGAGTGKTKVIVDRYVRCVLDPERGAGDVRAVAAITFTEKAAGELRQRIREEFERQASSAAEGPEADRVQAALEALDDAPIGTIHGFAGRLLREFPVEAGVDPAFEQLDALGSDLEGARLWGEWLAQLAAGHRQDEAVRAALARLLRAGVRLDALRDLAVGARGVFGERYDLDPAPIPSAEPNLKAGLAALQDRLGSLRDFCATACGDQCDRGFGAAMGLVDACDVLLAEPPPDVDRLAAALYDLPAKLTPSAPGGARGNWDDARGGKPELQARYRALAAGAEALRDEYASYLTATAVAVTDAFSRWAGAAQVALGRLDFTDLLGCLRDVLLHDRRTRAALQRRLRYVLVDEFQDTDPLQAEIVFYLCEREPVAYGWLDVVLEPGKLFVVGDPKQSIYRFRRADIGMYDEVKSLISAQPGGTGIVTAIRQNFRTTPRVVAWVNNVFATVFDDDQEEGRQPGYQWVEPFRPQGDDPRVVVMTGGEYGSGAGTAAAARQDEARAVAALLSRMLGEDAWRWRVQDRDAEGFAEEALREPRWGDIAVLYRTTTGLDTLEDALRAAGVPYRVEGGATYFARREVDDALLCLRAVDDPSDGPALYGALHSTFFGCSDDDLVLFWAAGGRFDLFAAEQPPGHEAVRAGLSTLRGLHDLRAEREPHELIAELVRRTRAAQLLAATGPGAAQAVANLDKLVERARAFVVAGGGGLGAFLTWAAEAGDAAGEQESQIDDDGDLVRLLTIHKAKGLEYPIVVVIGGAQGNSGARGEPIVERGARTLHARLRVALPGSAEKSLESQRCTALREREKRMAESELRRLLYVATTRARDRLVLTCFGSPVKKDGEPTSGALLGPVWASLPAPVVDGQEREEDGVLVLPPLELAAADEPDGPPDVDRLLAARDAWVARRAATLENSGRPARATSPSGLEHVDEEVRSGGAGAPPGRARALALGSVVHRVMEVCNLHDEASVARVAGPIATELGWPDIAHEAEVLAMSCWRSAPVRAAAEAAAADPEAVYRELPVGAMVDDVLVGGALDLCFRDGDAWVIVDYKTDKAAAPDVLQGRYRPQGAAYVVALEAALRGPSLAGAHDAPASCGAAMDEGARGDCVRVREVCFVAARADGLVVRIPVDDELRSLARREIGAAAAAGRTIAEDELEADRATP